MPQVRTDDITMIAIYLEETGSLAMAHEAERAALETAALADTANGGASGKDGKNPAAGKRQSMRELRRKSSAMDPSLQVSHLASNVGNNKQLSGNTADSVCGAETT